jgi:hypothetical protein
VQWGNYFPTMSALPTADPRIFQTEWEKVAGEGMGVIKRKQFFACAIVSAGAEGDCYGIEVFKRWSEDPRAAITEALEKMKQATDYRESHDTWPSQDPKQSTQGDDPAS